MAVTASTATTVAVFLPIIFVEGVAGQIFRDQALTELAKLSKAGLITLTRALAKIMAPDVFVNGISPGVVLLPEGCDENAWGFAIRCFRCCFHSH